MRPACEHLTPFLFSFFPSPSDLSGFERKPDEYHKAPPKAAFACTARCLPRLQQK